MLTRSKTRTIIAVLIILIIALLFLIIGSAIPAHWPSWVSILLYNIGSFLLASIAIGLIFEFWQLRSLLEDLNEQAGISERLSASGITNFSTSFYDNIDWARLLSSGRRVGILFAYGATWRHSHRAHLEAFLGSPTSELTVVVPDRYCERVMEELGRRFTMEVEDLKRRVEEAEDFFSHLGERLPGLVRIYRTQRTPVFSVYLFDGMAVLSTYRHGMDRGPVLSLVGDRGGELYEWVLGEWNVLARELVDVGTTRQVYPD